MVVDVATPQGAGRYKLVIAGLTMTLYFTFGLSIFAVAPVTPLIMEEYGVNRSTASLLVGLVLLLQASLSIPGAMLAGRLPLKWVIAAGWLMVATPALTFLATSFPVLLGLRLVYGLASAFLLPSIAPLLMQWFKPKEVPLVNSLNIALISLGIAISTFVVTPLSDALGWQTALSLFGGASLLGALAWAVLGRVQGQAQVQPTRFSIRDTLTVLRWRATVLLAVANGGAFALYSSLTAWLPTYYSEVVGMSLGKAASLVGILPLVGMASLLVAGFASTRVRARKPFLIIPGIVIGFGGFGAVFLGDTPLLLAALMLVGFGAWFYQPTLFSIPMELPGVRPESVSLIWGAIISIAGVIGFLAPLFVGAMADATGSYVAALSVLCIGSWGLAAGALFLPETGRAVEGAAVASPAVTQDGAVRA